MKKNAFTLVELMAIIVIMASILLIILPAINGTIKNSEEKKKQDALNSIYMAAENYVMSNYDEYSSLDDIGAVEYVYITDLISNNYLSIDTINPNNDLAFNNKDAVKVTKKEDGTFSYELIVAQTIYDVVINNFPYLEVGENGCKNPGDNNYSYMGGCYIKGNPDNNYVWYSGFLWRIMGINPDGTIRLITGEPVSAIAFGNTTTANTWETSYQKKWLNEYFLNHLIDNEYIVEQFYCSDQTNDINSARNNCTKESSKSLSKVGLMTLDEYNLAGGKNSYLCNGFFNRTMTPGGENKFWGLNELRGVDNAEIIFGYGSNPVINIINNIIIEDGNGKLNSESNEFNLPYIIFNNNKSNILSERVTSGEYIKFSNKVYRVVSKDKFGNIKIVLDGFYLDSVGEIVLTTFGSSNVFNPDINIGKTLNTDVYDWLIENELDKNKILENYTWYQTSYTTGISYEKALAEDDSVTKIIATVGLLRVGEMMSSQAYSVYTEMYTIKGDSKNTKPYWLLNYWDSSYGWEINSGSGMGWPLLNTRLKAIRPAIVIKSDVEIISGTGTFSNPYQI